MRFLVSFSSVLVVLTASAVLAQQAREPVEISVLTYNVHGLADLLVDDDPRGRMPKISALLGAYDVVLIQEDWSYHELLTEQAAHAVVERGNPSQRALAAVLPFLFSGSGLTVLARDRDQLVSAERGHFGHCAGWLGGGMDCYASKGFVQLRLRLPNGAEVDFYDLHLDAGNGVDDQLAREAQLARLRERVELISDDRALVIAGDFNLNFQQTEQRLSLLEWGAELKLRDSLAQHQQPELWERIDYIFYRSGRGVTLNVIERGQATEFASDGTPLSDHPALFTRLRIQ